MSESKSSHQEAQLSSIKENAESLQAKLKVKKEKIRSLQQEYGEKVKEAEAYRLRVGELEAVLQQVNQQ